MSEILDLRQSNNTIKENESSSVFAPAKEKKKWLKPVIVIVLSVIMTTIGVKASDTLFSSDKNGLSNSICSSDMVFIPNSSGGFCLDKFEASASDNCPSVNPASQIDTRNNLNSIDCIAESKKGAIPWRNISQNQAAIACSKAGKRLPTNKEWLQASLGTPDKNSSWGRDDCQLASNWSSHPGKTGSGKKCISSVGAYDMIGNVWEWVDETINDGKYKGIDLPGDGYVNGVDSSGMPATVDSDNPDLNYNSDYMWIKKDGVKGVLRGGFWSNKNQGGIYSTYLVFPPSFAGGSVGFRCVK